MAAAVRLGHGGAPLGGKCLVTAFAVAAAACAVPVLLVALADASGSRLVVPWSDSPELADATWPAFLWRLLCALARVQRLPAGDVGPAGVLHSSPPPDAALFPSVVGKLGATLYTNRTLEGPPPGWLEVYPLRLVDGGSITVRARSESIGCRGPNDFVTLHATAADGNTDWVDWAPVTEEDHGQFASARGAAWLWERGGWPWRVGIRGNDRLYVRLKRLPAPCGPHFSIPTVHVPPPPPGAPAAAGTGAGAGGEPGAAGAAGTAGAGARGTGDAAPRWVAAEAQESRRVFFFDEAGSGGSTWHRRETTWGGAEDGWARFTVYDPEAAPCVRKERAESRGKLIQAGPKATDPKPPRLPAAAVEVRYWCNLTDVLDASALGRKTHVRYIMGARTGPIYFERLAAQWEHPSVLASRTRRRDAPGTTKQPPGAHPQPPKTPPPWAAGGTGAGGGQQPGATAVAAAQRPQDGVPRDDKFERYRLFSRFKRLRRRGIYGDN